MLSSWLLLPWLFAAEMSLLGSPDFAVRDKAQGRLASWPLWGHVVGRAGLQHTDPEVRDRCGRLLVRRLLYLEAGWRDGGAFGLMAAVSLTAPQKWSGTWEGRFWCHDPQRLMALDRTARRLNLMYSDDLTAYQYPPCWRGTFAGLDGAVCGVINACRMRYRGEKIPGYGY